MAGREQLFTPYQPKDQAPNTNIWKERRESENKKGQKGSDQI